MQSPSIEIIVHMLIGIPRQLLGHETSVLEGRPPVAPVPDEALPTVVGTPQRLGLHEDFAALTTLEALQRATRDWEANNRDDKYLVHHAGRLEDAEKPASERPDLDEALTRSDRGLPESLPQARG